MRCTNCGNKIKGKKPVVHGETITTFSEGWPKLPGGIDNGKEIVEKVNLCSWPCAWQYGIAEHFYMGEEEAIKHLIEMHGYPKEGPKEEANV